MKNLILRAILVVIGSAFASTSWASANDWNGGYIGINMGDGISESSLRTTAVDTTGAQTYLLHSDIAQIDGSGSSKVSSQSFMGGGQAGYDIQAGRIVYGIQADIDAFNLKESHSTTVQYFSAPGTFFTVNQGASSHWLLTVHPRLGWVVGNSLIYGTAGLAVSRLQYDGEFTDTFTPASESNSFSKNQVGWTVGVGEEYRMTEHWSIKIEYLFTDFGSFSYNNSPLAVPPGSGDIFNRSADMKIHMVRLGLNYKF
jgi:outer membrane immunogenic protein